MSVNNSRDKRILIVEKSTNKDLLRSFIDDENDWLRSAVAANQATPLDCLEKLAKDHDWFVRCGVTRNLLVSLECLNLLGRDRDLYVIAGVKERFNIQTGKRCCYMHPLNYENLKMEQSANHEQL